MLENQSGGIPGVMRTPKYITRYYPIDNTGYYNNVKSFVGRGLKPHVRISYTNV